MANPVSFLVFPKVPQSSLGILRVLDLCNPMTDPCMNQLAQFEPTKKSHHEAPGAVRGGNP